MPYQNYCHSMYNDFFAFRMLFKNCAFFITRQIHTIYYIYLLLYTFVKKLHQVSSFSTSLLFLSTSQLFWLSHIISYHMCILVKQFCYLLWMWFSNTSVSQLLFVLVWYLEMNSHLFSLCTTINALWSGPVSIFFLAGWLTSPARSPFCWITCSSIASPKNIFISEDLSHFPTLGWWHSHVSNEDWLLYQHTLTGQWLWNSW